MSMDKLRILWADDEIDLLKPHILFLESKGYKTDTVNNGREAVEMIGTQNYDIVFLDEHMPGLTGLETLMQIKAIRPHLPVVMITKSEEESIMEDAIGSKIADYLIKPVNPNQILLCLKKNLDERKLVSEKSSMSYQQEFRTIGSMIGPRLTHQEWYGIYKKLCYYEIDLEKNEDQGILDILAMQKTEANAVFSRYIENNYKDWIQGKSLQTPVMSHTLLRNKLFPMLQDKTPVYLIVIDNLRYDQWKALEPLFAQYFRIENDDLYFSILPTATQYARNALFAGLMPLEIARKYPKFWVDELDEGTKNQYEGELVGEYMKRFGLNIRYSYNKILNLQAGRKLADTINNLNDNPLNIIVYNFVDMLSHARTEMEVIRELADDEAAYRSLTQSWFNHSPLLDIVKHIGEKGGRILLTTDHGSVKCQNPLKLLGDRNTNTNLRYKFGKNLNFNSSDVFEVRHPEEIFLPRANVSTSFVFCRENDYFVYPNNYSHFANMYRNTFQHGGISMEEILVPVIEMRSKT
ncbi:MAG TPA: PglZ domain-containing protein [Bacteroidales bacterium]|nr:PglZ domain-containing protein [Bacteroidales bacterium]